MMLEHSQKNPERHFSVHDLVKHWRYLVIFVLVAALAGMYFWKEYAIDQTQKELRKQAEQAAWRQNVSFLPSLSMALAWAVRAEMIRGNYGQIDQYFVNIVRQPNLNGVVLAKPDGVILLATDKKLEGTQLAQTFPREVLKADKTTVSSYQKGLLAVTPITNLNVKLGVLVMIYTPSTVVLARQ